MTEPLDDALADEIEQSVGLLMMMPGKGGTRSLGIKKTAQVVAALRAALVPPSSERPEAEYVKKVCKALRAGHQYSGIVDEVDVAAANLIETLYLAALPALSSFPEAGREAIARIIDANAFAWDQNHPHTIKLRERALAKADAIRALSPRSATR